MTAKKYNKLIKEYSDNMISFEFEEIKNTIKYLRDDLKFESDDEYMINRINKNIEKSELKQNILLDEIARRMNEK